MPKDTAKIIATAALVAGSWKLKAIQASRFPRTGLQGRPFLDHPGLDVGPPSEKLATTEIVERKIAHQYKNGTGAERTEILGINIETVDSTYSHETA